MLEDKISPYIISTSDKNNSDKRDGTPQSKVYMQDQVDNCSRFSEEDDVSQMEDLVIAASPNNVSSVPFFESVSVVNSNDVHFGNKTIYQGPVTIKQIVYSDKKSDIKSLESENILVANINNSNNVSCGSEFSGLCNPGFEKEDTKLGSSESEKSPSNGHVDKLFQENTVKYRILRCCNYVGKRRLKCILITFSIAVVLIVISSAIFLGMFKSPTMVHVGSDIQNNETEEEDNQTPVDYSSDSNNTFGPKVRTFTRLEWLAQPPVDKLDPLKLPVSLIIIQHTSTEGCDSQAQCIFQTRIIQTFHIESRGWFDIAYNFLVGGDGNAYEGRGWKNEGAHTYGYNNISIGFGFIGTFNSNVPPPRQTYAFKKLVEEGVRLGYITKDYKIVAARQLYATESPGKTFFEEIKKWKHWSNKL